MVIYRLDISVRMTSKRSSISRNIPFCLKFCWYGFFASFYHAIKKWYCIVYNTIPYCIVVGIKYAVRGCISVQLRKTHEVQYLTGSAGGLPGRWIFVDRFYADLRLIGDQNWYMISYWSLPSMDSCYQMPCLIKKSNLTVL